MSRSVQNLEAALAGCLDDLQAGMTPAQCLARYPEYADQLGPLLLTAERLQGQVWPALSTSSRVRGRERMHAALASRRPAGFDWWSVLKPLASALVLLVLAGGVWLAWPGRLTKNISPLTSAPVLVSATPAPSLTVGLAATPTLTATSSPTATSTPTRASGATTPVPTQADVPEMFERLDGTKMPVAAATLRTRYAATSGARASTPEPTQTASPGRPQQTPRNDATPEATIEVTEAPRASATHEPTATRKPTETREPTESPRPTSTPWPSSTAEPTEPPHATATRASTETPEPSKMPESTEMPRSSETSEPTKTPDHD